MGAFLDKPKTDKDGNMGVGNLLAYGVSSMQGWRVEMEDAHCTLLSLPNPFSAWSFFAVFDGHAGGRVSSHCAKNLIETIIQSEEICNYTDASDCNHKATPEDIEKVQSCIRNGFLQLDEQMKKIPEIASGVDKSGTTAVCVLITPTHFFFANCGDSRAVLSRSKWAFFVTEDHKPVNPAEKERIQKAGGSVMIQRVNGSLAVSRALGDYDYKQVEGKGPCEQLVSPEPEVSVLERDDTVDEFLVLACDGVWDVMTNEELCDNIRYQMQIESDLEKICSSVIDACLLKGSRDNMSIIIVRLPAAPSENAEILSKDKEVNKVLEARMKAIFSGADNLELFEIVRGLDFDTIAHNTMTNLPQGAVFFKHSFLEQTRKELKDNFSEKSEEKHTEEVEEEEEEEEEQSMDEN